ncbi:alpha/beta hydrolase family protein [Streptacidiphilus neutrinimicus]|uniref:alpha/beta hydrolase family protein n=1 Tax=Streptacidiphilus neutrinimicus TaxID=105420 RepID=UPI0013768BF1|nr:hydrolase [Streptacidiphilus neutrinimicus]
MSTSRIVRSRLLVRAAGTLGAVAIGLGATVSPAAASTPHHGTEPGNAAPDAPFDDTAVAKAQAAANAAAHGGHLETRALPKSRAAPTGQNDSGVTPAIPAPTGPYQVGTVNLHLVDRTRYDPWVPTYPRRELMVQLWYPATQTSGHALAPWLQSEAADSFLSSWNVWPGSMDVPTTAGHLGAPVDPKAGKLPVLLYSTGLHSDRSQGTALAEDMASRGYLVVMIDSTHEANEVQFPGPRLETATPASSKYTLTVRAADAKFVVNELGLIAGGKDPDVDGAALPSGLSGNVDMSRIGMFGWSYGGPTVLDSMTLDPRIAAGADLDGQLYGPQDAENLNRPFLLFGASYHDRREDSSWASVWSHLTGPKYELKLAGTEHLSFSDYETLFSQAGEEMGLTPGQVQQDIGTLAPSRAIYIMRTYLAAYFDTVLHIKTNPLMSGPSKSFPEVSFIR